MTRTRKSIALVRHARSAHLHSGWIDSAGFRSWREAYEAAGIVEGERPPAAVAALAGKAGLVLSSDSPRALATALLLAKERPVVTSPLLRELDLLGPSLGPLPLPLPAWALAVGLRTFALMLLGRYPNPAEGARIGGAADLLEELAAAHSQLVVVTHASIRRRLFQTLVLRGFRAVPGDRSSRHWSCWELERRISP